MKFGWIHITRPRLFALGFARSAFIGSIFLAGIQAGWGRPNFVVILAEDLGWGDLSIHGNSIVDTPHLDRLASESARLDRFFVSSKSATSRASLLTGRHFLLTGVSGETQGTQLLHEAEITFGDIFKADGYRTGYFGKWQNGFNHPLTPRGQGFDTFVGRCKTDWTEFEDTELRFDDQLRNTQGPVVSVLTDSLLQFIQEAPSDQPFLACISCPEVPFTDRSSRTYVEHYLDQGCSEELAQLYGSVEHLDHSIGRILAQLHTAGIAQDTVILFTSVTGPKAIDGRYNDSMYGAQGSLHEGGLRVPCFFRWPEVLPAGLVIKEISQNIDLFPTLIDLADADLPNDRTLHGLSLAPLLRTGHVERWPNRNLNFIDVPGRDLPQARKSARNTRWRAVKDEKWRRIPISENQEQWELYDMLADPYQSYNVAHIYPFVLARLKV